MANEFSQQLSTPGVQFGIPVDKSGLISNPLSNFAKGAEFVGGAVMGAAKENALSGVEAEINNNVDAYNKQSPSVIAQTQLDLQKAQTKLNDPLTPESQLPSLLKEIQRSQEFLQNAKNQGKMNEFEFTTRISDITRQAVNRNPAFTKEILAKAQDILDLNNIQKKISLDNALYKEIRADAEQQKSTLRDASNKLFGFPMFYKRDADGRMVEDYDTLQMKVMEASKDKMISDKIEQEIKLNKNINDRDAQRVVDNGIHWVLAKNYSRSAFAELSVIANDPNVPAKDKPTALQTALDQKIADLQSNPVFTKFETNPSIKTARDSTIDQLKNAKAAFEKDATGENTLKILQNLTKVNDEVTKIQMINAGMDPERIRMLNLMAPYANMIKMNRDQQNALFSWINTSVSKMNEDMNYASNPDHKDQKKINIDNMFTPGVVDLRSGKKVSVNTSYLNAAVDDIAKDRVNSIPVLKQAIDNFIAYKNFDFATISPQEKQAQQTKVFQAMDEIYQQIGTKDFEKATNHLSSYQINQLLQGVEDYNKAISKEFTKYRIDHPMENARISQGPQGTLIATGGSEDFHMKYLDRINTALKAYANLTGQKTNEISNDFYSRYYKDVFVKDVKDLNTVPSVKPIEEGNIDLSKRPVVKNADGTISTVRSMSVGIGGKEVLIPTVSEDGRIMTESEAIKQYLDTGRHLGKFNSVEEANAYATKLHEDQARMYSPGSTLTNFNSATPGGGANKKVSFNIPSIITEANAGEVDSKIIPKLIQQESKGVHINPSTMRLLESEKGAKGVTQVMPATGVDPGYGVKPLQNNTKEEYIRFSKDYFKAMLGEFNGDVEKALAAYNYGPVVVKQKIKQYGNGWKQHVPAETQNYIASIME